MALASAVQCSLQDRCAHSFLGWQRSTPQLLGDTFSDEMSLHDMTVALKMHSWQQLVVLRIPGVPCTRHHMVTQISSAKAAMMTIVRTGKELEMEHKNQISVTMTSDRRTYKKQVIFISITNYIPIVCP